MPNVRSSLGNIQQGANQPEMRTFTVEDRSRNFDIPQNAELMPQEYHPAPGEQVVNPNVAHLYNQQPPAAQQQQTQIRELTVDEWKELRNFASQEEAPLSPDARRRIDLLLGIGQVTRDVAVNHGGRKVVFSIRTLKAREQKHIVLLSNQFRQTQSNQDLMSLRDATLAYSLYAIDGMEIDMILGCPHKTAQERMYYRGQFLIDLDNDLLNHLFEQYSDMVTSDARRFAVTTEAQAREVVSDLRKSGQTA